MIRKKNLTGAMDLDGDKLRPIEIIDSHEENIEKLNDYKNKKSRLANFLNI